MKKFLSKNGRFAVNWGKRDILFYESSSSMRQKPLKEWRKTLLKIAENTMFPGWNCWENCLKEATLQK